MRYSTGKLHHPELLTEHMEKQFEKKNDELQVKLAKAETLTLALTAGQLSQMKVNFTATCNFISADWEVQSSCSMCQTKQNSKTTCRQLLFQRAGSFF